jgi:MFS family permease
MHGYRRGQPVHDKRAHIDDEPRRQRLGRVVAPSARRRTWSRRASFWLVVGAQVLLFAGSTFPTPLFPIYEQRYGFGSGVVTILFGVYVAVLVPTLLLLGPVADRIGRRPLLVTGIAVTALSSTAFAGAQSLAWLFAGEAIYGIGSGLVMSCVAVAIRELHPRQHLASAALAASVAMAAGLTLGPLVSGLLAWGTPWPSVSPYLLDIVLASLLAAALVRIPETRPTAPAVKPRTPIIHVPADMRKAFLATAVAGASSFMVIGWVFGLSPSYLHEQLHIQVTQSMVAGSFAALVVLANGAAQLALRRHHSAGAMRVSLAGVVVGMGLMASATAVSSLAVVLVGGVVAGAGAGVAQMNAMATIQRIAPVHARGSVTSAYFTLCYLALSVPVIIAGEAADRLGLGSVTAWYFVGLTIFVGSALVLAHRFAAGPAEDSVAGPLHLEPAELVLVRR